MAFDLPTPRAAIVLELAARGAERIPKRNEGILVCRCGRACVADCDHLVRKPDLDVEVVQRAVVPVSVRRCHDDSTVRDARMEFLQARDQGADAALERSRVIEMTESDLQRHSRVAVAGTPRDASQITHAAADACVSGRSRAEADAAERRDLAFARTRSAGEHGFGHQREYGAGGKIRPLDGHLA
jgi:hypothetical protein